MDKKEDEEQKVCGDFHICVSLTVCFVWIFLWATILLLLDYCRQNVSQVMWLQVIWMMTK